MKSDMKRERLLQLNFFAFLACLDCHSTPKIIDCLLQNASIGKKLLVEILIDVIQSVVMGIFALKIAPNQSYMLFRQCRTTVITEWLIQIKNTSELLFMCFRALAKKWIKNFISLIYIFPKKIFFMNPAFLGQIKKLKVKDFSVKPTVCLKIVLCETNHYVINFL